MAKAKKETSNIAETDIPQPESQAESNRTVAEATTDVPIVEPEKIKEPVVEVKEPSKMIDPKASHEDRIMSFLESRGNSTFVRLNDFLKSLYPLPQPNQKPEWVQQHVAKALKGTLSKLATSGQIIFKDDSYLQLGKNYYHDGNPETKYRDLSSVLIEAKLP